jgi:signal transduction histidine kinase
MTRPLLDRDFATHARAVTARYVRIAAAALAISTVLFWPLDHVLFPADTTAAFRIWRAAILVLSLLALLLVRTLELRGGIVLVTSVIFVVGSTICGHALARARAIDQPWFYCVYFLPMLFLPMVVPLWQRIAGTTAIGVGFFTAYFLTHQGAIARPAMGGSLAFMVFGVGALVIGGHLFYRLIRENFEQRRLLAERATRLEELDRTKNELFANVSHEFRTPLTLVMTQLRALRDVDPARATAGLRNCARLLLLVDELLELARLRGHRAPARRHRVDLAKVAVDVASAFRSDAARSDELVLSGVDTPCWVWADPQQVRTAIYNLLSNAYKFSDAATRRVRLELARGGDDVEISLVDNGIGMAPDVVARIFDRFVQADGGAARRHGGVGIGLALVSEIARAHGGRVDVASEPGRGSRFTLVLPAGSPGPGAGEDSIDEARVEQLEIFGLAGSAPAAPPRPPTPPAARACVLVVEDDPELRRHLTATLDHRFRALGAADGAEALASAEREPPDLIVTDLMTPRMSGLDLVRELRKRDALARVPVLVITARDAATARAEAYAAGADDLLTKPFDDEELLARASNLLTLRRQEGELARMNLELERRIAERTEELRHLAAHLDSAREEERRRLARELHDQAGQLLSGLRLEVALGRKLSGTTEVREVLARMDAILDEIFALIRDVVSELRPRVLDEMGLAAAVRWYLREFQRRTGLACDAVMDEVSAAPAVATATFRIVQEALTNVARHAEAARVQVTLRQEGGAVRLVVADDGKGFDPDGLKPGRFGLLGMTERAQALGGVVRVTSRPGSGTVCTALLRLDVRST